VLAIGEAAWEIMKAIPDDLQDAVKAHLRHNCQFTFDGPHRLTGEPVAFYGAALLCRLELLPGCKVVSARKKKELKAPATYNFLFRTVDEDEVLVPLTGGEGDMRLAKRWLGLSLRDDAQRLDYARFYCAFARTGDPPGFHNIPRRVSEIRFAGTATEKQIWGVYGAMWRFLVDPQTLEVGVHFEPRGSFWRARHRAHLPIQFGDCLYDVDLKIWDRDGHVSYRKAGLIFKDDALAEESTESPGKIGRPRYVSRSEWFFTVCQNVRTALYQAAYLVVFAVFLLASAVALALPLDLWGIPLLRLLLDLIWSVAGIGDWTPWLLAASLYCIAYFALTTLIILDVETLRTSLLTWSPRFRKSRINELLYAMVVKSRIVENGYRRGFWRRIRTAATWLAVWTAYLVCVFTSLQTSLRPQLANDPRALWDIMQVFGEQALLYIPVVFYYVGRKSLDPEKMALVSFWVLVSLQLVMGLLVIRRIHRYWASTAAARLNEQIVRTPPNGRG
jgi:hypothetical protein